MSTLPVYSYTTVVIDGFAHGAVSLGTPATQAASCDSVRSNSRFSKPIAGTAPAKSLRSAICSNMTTGIIGLSSGQGAPRTLQRVGGAVERLAIICRSALSPKRSK